jgi:CubicO group peptidase (beta-lactamase class C family)
MDRKNNMNAMRMPEVGGIMRNTRVLLSLALVLAASSCFLVVGQNNPEGIWHTEAQYHSGQMVAMEFELQKSFFGRGWSGCWEMMEVMSRGDLKQVQVTDSNIEVVLHANLKFKGALSADGTSLVGILYASGQEIPQTYTRVDNWANRMPARMDDQGKSIKSWQYQTPDLIDDEWAVASLSDARIRQQPLDDLFQKILKGQYQGLDAVLVARGGKLVLEEYFHFGSRSEIHQIQSVTKSVTSLVFGMAYDDGLIGNLEQPVHQYFPDYSDSSWVMNEYPISLRNVLMMSAGLDWKEHGVSYTNSRNDAIRMNVSGDMYGYVLSREEGQGKQPGEKFEYTSGLSILLGGVILEATGMSIDKYAKKTLFKELGVEDYYWSAPLGQVHTGGGLYMQPRDLLKLGQLVLDKGRWNGKQVISEAWIEKSTSFQIPVEDLWKGCAYGYQWWREVLQVDQKSYPVIFGSGYGWQMLWIIPDLDLVVLVFHHNPEEGAGRHSLIWDGLEKIILPAVLVE